MARDARCFSFWFFVQSGSMLLLCLTSCFAANSIWQGQSINSSSSLALPGGYNLGFRRIGMPEFNGSFLAIWKSSWSYNLVWIANRETPIADDSGVLSIDGSGHTMKLSCSTGDVVNLYSAPPSYGGGLVAVLEETGNFVLRDRTGNSTGRQVLWQSFDHPTDSLLPGMKLGTDPVTGKKTHLVSWSSEYDPKPGAFTMEWDSKNRRLIIMRRGVLFWANTPSNLFTDMEGHAPLVSAANEDYFIYKVKYNYNNALVHWRLMYDGTLSFNQEQEHGITSYMIACDGNTTEHGCVRWNGPACRNDGHKFVLRIGLFDGDYYTDKSSNFTIGDCKDICWKNCSCSGTWTYSTLNGLVGCIFASGAFTQDLTGAASQWHIIVSKERAESSRSKTSYWVWIVAAVPFLLVGALLSKQWQGRRRRNREKFLIELLQVEDEVDGTKEGERFVVFRFSTIMAATNSMNNSLGNPSSVYYGKLNDGTEIAVKRCLQMNEFKAEIALQTKLQHKNLVRLLGCCFHGESRMLIYEYMPNKSLDQFIFDASRKKLLGWRKRWEIIEGVAQGLLYLHEYSRLRIVHRDLKPGNVQLDENMNPKISGFGIAKVLDGEDDQETTDQIMGTWGYLAPEYAMDGTFSAKSDIFSFGVVTLEMVSGRKNGGQDGHLQPLIEHAWELWNEGKALEVMDSSLRESDVDERQVLRSIHVALLCVEDNATDRPTMSDVITMLSSNGEALPSPKKPSSLRMAQPNLEASVLETTSSTLDTS